MIFRMNKEKCNECPSSNKDVITCDCGKQVCPDCLYSSHKNCFDQANEDEKELP